MQILHGRLKYMAFLSFSEIQGQIYVTVTVYKLCGLVKCIGFILLTVVCYYYLYHIVDSCTFCLC